MSFDLIVLTLLITGWAICGVVPWLALSVATKGNAGLIYLPLSMFAAVVLALLVPFLGATGMGGLWLSFAVALVGPALLLGARRFSLVASDRERRVVSQPVHGRSADTTE